MSQDPSSPQDPSPAPAQDPTPADVAPAAAADDAPGAAETAYRHIRQSIVTGDLAPGIALKETTLAQQIGVSRTPVREALNRLQSEGLVELERFRRGRVAEFSIEDAAEIFHLRALLESHGAGRAATRITPDRIDRLRVIEDEMESLFADLGWHHHLARFDELNNQFHGIVAGAADSPRLEKILASSLELPASIFNHYNEPHEERTRRTHRQHHEIIDALSAGDPDWARTAMQAHLLSLVPRPD